MKNNRGKKEWPKKCFITTLIKLNHQPNYANNLVDDIVFNYYH